MNINFKFSKFICAIITLIATPIHELGHLVGYQLSGIPAKFNFIYTESINGSESLLGCLGGPVISLLLALAGCIIIYIFKNKRNAYVWMYFTITMCFTRLLPYLLLIFINNKETFAINDEGLVAKFLNVPVWGVYVFLLLYLFVYCCS
ncbi:hypothetical protein ACYUJ6_03230 [Clostridium sp. JNZ X4-2]